jgi:glycosyltransferase involved in cell wall biosynthesis
MNTLKISVIIPSYKRSADLRRCLAALAVQFRLADEILVIARRDDRETAFTVHESSFNLGRLRIVHVCEPGLIAALNCGLENATGDILVFTDDDSEAHPDWLERIEATFADSRVGAVGGRDWLQLPREPLLFSPPYATHVGTMSWYGAMHGNHHCPIREHVRNVNFLKGVNMAYRRAAVGNYRIDRRLRGSGAQVGTEIDLCMQSRRAGFSVLFDDRILVKHFSASRPAGDGRNDLSSCVWPDACFNIHYLVAKHFGASRSLIHLATRFLIGSRTMPGLMASLKWSLSGDLLIWRRMFRIASVAWEGFLVGRAARTLGTKEVHSVSSAPGVAHASNPSMIARTKSSL